MEEIHTPPASTLTCTYTAATQFALHYQFFNDHYEVLYVFRLTSGQGQCSGVVRPGS